METALGLLFYDLNCMAVARMVRCDSKRQLLFVMWNVKYTLRRIFSQNFDDLFSLEPFGDHKRNSVKGGKTNQISFKITKYTQVSGSEQQKNMRSTS